jgi:hypothetical protein
MHAKTIPAIVILVRTRAIFLLLMNNGLAEEISRRNAT